MNVYTYSEARRRFAAILDEARAKGSVLIRRRDGQEFLLRPVKEKGSPLDVEGLDWAGAVRKSSRLSARAGSGSRGYPWRSPHNTPLLLPAKLRGYPP